MKNKFWKTGFCIVGAMDKENNAWEAKSKNQKTISTFEFHQKIEVVYKNEKLACCCFEKLTHQIRGTLRMKKTTEIVERTEMTKRKFWTRKCIRFNEENSTTRKLNEKKKFEIWKQKMVSKLYEVKNGFWELLCHRINIGIYLVLFFLVVVKKMGKIKLTTEKK